MTAAILGAELVPGVPLAVVDEATLALSERGRALMIFDPTLWPREQYRQRLDVSIHNAVHRWLAKEDRRITRWTQQRSGRGR